MNNELRKWCEENEFDIDKFKSLDLSLEKLAETKSIQISVLAEELGMASSERGRFIDAVKLLKQRMGIGSSPISPTGDSVGFDNNGYNQYNDDPEVVVKGGNDPTDDYNEFENNNNNMNNNNNNNDNNDDEQKSIHEESFMLRSNFSDDPLDQWDIVKFFDQNDKFKQFKPILLLQMQIQNSPNYNNDNGMGQNQNDQLDHLLDSMLGNQHQNDSSSDSDDDIYNAEQDDNTFREYINMGYMPSPQSLIYDIVLNEYSFKMNNFRINEMDEKTPFFASINYAQCKGKEHWMSICLDNNINRDDYTRYKLNCVVVLETSSTMNESNKQQIGNEIICSILDELGDEDKFCLVTFNDSFNIEQPLDDIKSMDISIIKEEILSIESIGGSYDFDEGYNAALGQLQELFDAQIMAATNNNNDDNKDGEDIEIENRIIMITNNLPNSDSSLMDLIQVYSESDENKIYTTFLNIGDITPSNKLFNTINKMKGCNIRYYVESDKNAINNAIKHDFQYIVNPLFFNINLSVKQCKTDTIYGYKNNMKKITKLNATGSVKTIKTFFCTEDMNKNKEIITIRLQSEDNENNDISFEIELNYECRDGKIGDIKREIVLSVNKENGILDETENTYFDNTGIRKRILLIKYIELMNEWVARDSFNGNTNLNVSDQFKNQFIAFLKYFNYEMEQIKDNELNQEVEILNNLINFDETKADELRKSAAT